MATFPAADYMSDAARTEGEFKTALEAFLAAAKTLPGGQAGSELTIAGGSITPTSSAHSIDTEADAAADNLDAIALDNMPEGRLLFLQAESAARVVTLRHGQGGLGQILLTGAEDVVLDDQAKVVILRRDGDAWSEVGRLAFTPSVAAGLMLESSPAADHEAHGVRTRLVAAEPLVFGDVCYINASGEAAKADAAALSTAFGVFLCVSSAVAQDDDGDFLSSGYARDDSWAWTPGTVLYLSEVAAGAIADAMPSSGGQAIPLAVALSASAVDFRPALYCLEVE